MSKFTPFLRHLSRLKPLGDYIPAFKHRKPPQSPIQFQTRRYAQHNPAEDSEWISVVDRPPVFVRSGNKHGPGLIILAIIPLTAFGLGTWQVQRLGWKTELLARYEDRLTRPPLPLPPHINQTAIPDFDYRRVFARGKFRHDQEMLLGPRTHDGADGYHVITPLERWDENGKAEGKILVCRGWIPRSKELQKDRTGPDALPQGDVIVQGLLREPYKRNFVSPKNDPSKEKWHFPDIPEMAKHVGAEPVYIEETMTPDLIVSQTKEREGAPIGRAAAVNLRNNHAQYIFTWYALSAATSIMFWMLVKKPPTEIQRRVRQSNKW